MRQRQRSLAQKPEGLNQEYSGCSIGGGEEGEELDQMLAPSMVR